MKFRFVVQEGVYSGGGVRGYVYGLWWIVVVLG